jgi:hypothetical protein
MKTYITTKEIAAAVRSELKSALPSCRFSVTFDSFAGGSSITLCLMSGPLPALENGLGGAQINQYMLREGANDPFRNNGCTLTPFGLYALRKAFAIIEKYHWDDSEPQADYFSCNFYIHMGIGKWNRDYVIR